MRRCALACLALGFACASAGPSPRAPVEVRPSPAPEVEVLPSEDLVQAALIASGFESALGLRQARAKFEGYLGDVVAQAEGRTSEREKAQVLLKALHAKGSLLGVYDARATTIKDVLEHRRYNCVSASVIYNLAAQRLGLAVGAQLLPTHARSLLSVQEETKLVRIAVETTSAAGFDPDSQTEGRILANVAVPAPEGARALVSERGEVVSTRVLIGTIYVNRASIAQESGDLEGAERLFARGEAFATSSGMRGVLTDQRAALLAQLAADDVLSGDPKRYLRAYRTLKQAVKLNPKDETVKEAVFHNLRAAAERVINLRAERGDEAGLVKLAGEVSASGLSISDRSGLRAFALSEVARLRIEAGAYDEAVKAIDLALREQLGEGDKELANILRLNRLAALRLAALTHAKAGEYAAADAYLARIHGLTLTPQQRQQLSSDRLRIIHLVGNQRIDALDYLGAAKIYREGHRRFPKDDTCRHNLLAVLERLATPLVKAARCADAQPYLQEITMVDARAAFPAQARASCLIERARQSLDAGDAAEAVALLQSASPGKKEPSLTNALAVARARWVQDLVRKPKCGEARTQAARLRAMHHESWGASRVRTLLGKCR